MLNNLTTTFKKIVSAFKNETLPEGTTEPPVETKRVKRKYRRRIKTHLPVGFTSKQTQSMYACLKVISQAPRGSKFLLNLDLIIHPAYNRFREILCTRYGILSAEIILEPIPPGLTSQSKLDYTAFRNLIPKDNVRGVQITLAYDPKSAEQSYPVVFRHSTHNSDQVYEFTKTVYNKDLIWSLLPAHHLPEHAAFIKKLEELAPLSTLEEVFDITVGFNTLVTKDKKTDPSKYGNVQVFSAKTINLSPFIRNTTLYPRIKQIPSPSNNSLVRIHDVLITAYTPKSKKPGYAIVVEEIPPNIHHSNALIRIRPKPGVDPRMAKVFFALWNTEEYRQLYPHTPNKVQSIINVTTLAKLPIPYYKDEQMLEKIDNQISKLIALDEHKQSVNQNLLKIT